MAISHTFPGKRLTLYTFGEIALQAAALDDHSNYRLSGHPRTGDRIFAELVERVIGTDRTYRCKSRNQISPLLRNNKDG